MATGGLPWVVSTGRFTANLMNENCKLHFVLGHTFDMKVVPGPKIPQILMKDFEVTTIFFVFESNENCKNFVTC